VKLHHYCHIFTTGTVAPSINGGTTGILKPCRKPIWVCRISSDIGEAAIAHRVLYARAFPVHHLYSSMLASVNGRLLDLISGFKPITRRRRRIAFTLHLPCMELIDYPFFYSALVDTLWPSSSPSRRS
jgi:hypothetical protein